MHLIKSDLRSDKSSIKKTYILENFYYEMQNIIDIFDISNDLYDFIHNHFLNSKKKWLFLYIVFNIENIFSTIINFIRIINNRKKNITYIYRSYWHTKKKWIQINIITAIPLKYSLEEYLLRFLQKRNDNRKIFIEKKVNKNIVGGLILRIDDKEWDRSLEESFRKLRIHLKK